MPTNKPQTKTFVLPDMADRFPSSTPAGLPPDGYVITFSAVDGYYVAKPNAKTLGFTSTSTSPYTIVNEDVVLVTHAGTATVNLPVSPLSGYSVFIKDASGNASTNNITVSAAALIDTSLTAVINTNFGALHVAYTGTTWVILSKF